MARIRHLSAYSLLQPFKITMFFYIIAILWYYSGNLLFGRVVKGETNAEKNNAEKKNRKESRKKKNKSA